jgi:hypothetical protein
MSEIVVAQEGPSPVAELLGAQSQGLLAELRRKRTEIASQLDKLNRQRPTGHAQTDKLNADLGVEMRNGLKTIDQLIGETEAFALAMGRENPPA